MATGEFGEFAHLAGVRGAHDRKGFDVGRVQGFVVQVIRVMVPGEGDGV